MEGRLRSRGLHAERTRRAGQPATEAADRDRPGIETQAGLDGCGPASQSTGWRRRTSGRGPPGAGTPGGLTRRARAARGVLRAPGLVLEGLESRQNLEQAVKTLQSGPQSVVEGEQQAS